jgi:hypothetical protein
MRLRWNISTVQLGGELPGTMVRLDYNFHLFSQRVQIVTQNDKGVRSLDLTP